ncbi:MAG: DUF3006 domain-containing protein [Myxococcaceae bacterium]|nr:DUF3006 domain-containing protein [Myxococcaceae bacterium]MCI0670550.1 DUF3006 domain-containing protein [Myxococcaceae bacterium]
MERWLLTAALLAAGRVGAGEAGERTASSPLPCTDARRELVDRLEGSVAVLVTAGGRVAHTVPRLSLPPGAREGDVLVAGVLRPDCRRVLLGEVARQRARRRGPASDVKGALTAGGERR